VQLYESVEDIPANEEVIAAFGSLGACLRTSFWALFGLIELSTLTVEGKNSQRIQVTGEMVFGVYMVGCQNVGENGMSKLVCI
jgi:hypothetical protein